MSEEKCDLGVNVQSGDKLARRERRKRKTLIRSDSFKAVTARKSESGNSSSSISGSSMNSDTELKGCSSAELSQSAQSQPLSTTTSVSSNPASTNHKTGNASESSDTSSDFGLSPDRKPVTATDDLRREEMKEDDDEGGMIEATRQRSREGSSSPYDMDDTGLFSVPKLKRRKRRREESMRMDGSVPNVVASQPSPARPLELNFSGKKKRSAVRGRIHERRRFFGIMYWRVSLENGNQSRKHEIVYATSMNDAVDILFENEKELGNRVALISVSRNLIRP